MENGPPFKSEATPPSFHHFADHHFANQASLMMLPPGWGQCRVRTARSPTPDRKMPPSDDGKMMVGKMMVRRPDGRTWDESFCVRGRPSRGPTSVANVLLGCHFHAPWAVWACR